MLSWGMHTASQCAQSPSASSTTPPARAAPRWSGPAPTARSAKAPLAPPRAAGGCVAW